MKFDTVVVGGGIAGLTSAAYISRAGRSVILFEKQDRVGGLVHTFGRNQVFFDSGLRSIEDSGIVKPMLRQLGIEIDLLPSPVSVGIGKNVLKLKDHNSLSEYEDFLKAHFPENLDDVSLIVSKIRKIMDYMDVLYGLDNPAFMNITEDKQYLLKVVLPWLFKFLFTIRKINQLNEPVNDYLAKLTKNQELIDMIAQHFFQKTPTSFALSYFRLYLDYFYPKGGTGVLMEKMEEFILRNGGVIKTSTTIKSLNPEEKYVIDDQGNRMEYNQLVWAGDMKLLYNSIPIETVSSPALRKKITAKKALLKDLAGGDSIFTVYLTVNETRKYFEDICTGHFFYTPVKTGLSTIPSGELEALLKASPSDPDNGDLKQRILNYLTDFCNLNTFEIAIPVLRDPELAPENRTGLIVSLLFEYQLAKKIEDSGWKEEIREFLELSFIRILDESIFPGLSARIVDRFSSSPMSLERLTGNTGGGITGWAFTNPVMPAVSHMLKVASSVDTPLPSVYQAGQWVFSPSGLPISILTGKLAADKVLKSNS